MIPNDIRTLHEMDDLLGNPHPWMVEFYGPHALLKVPWKDIKHMRQRLRSEMIRASEEAGRGLLFLMSPGDLVQAMVIANYNARISPRLRVRIDPEYRGDLPFDSSRGFSPGMLDRVNTLWRTWNKPGQPGLNILIDQYFAARVDDTITARLDAGWEGGVELVIPDTEVNDPSWQTFVDLKAQGFPLLLGATVWSST